MAENQINNTQVSEKEKNEDEVVNVKEDKVTNKKENKSVEMKVIAIPLDPLNKKNDTVKVTINGKETIIKRGVQQKVSKAVYSRLVIAGYIIEG